MRKTIKRIIRDIPQHWVEDGYRFKTLVRMLADTSLGLVRAKFMWPGIVEQQERIELVFATVRKQTSHGKTIPNPMLRNVAYDSFNCFAHRYALQGRRI